MSLIASLDMYSMFKFEAEHNLEPWSKSSFSPSDTIVNEVERLLEDLVMEAKIRALLGLCCSSYFTPVGEFGNSCVLAAAVFSSFDCI